MRTLLLIWAAFVTGQSIAQPTVQDFEYEITSAMLDWKSVEFSDFPAAKDKTFLKWKKDFDAEAPRFTKLDIDSDGNDELLVSDNDFPARGRAFLILQSQQGVWRNILEFRGGFILFRKNKTEAFRIHIYEKEHGVMKFFEMYYSNKKFKLKFETTLPRTIYDEKFYEKWRYLNRLNK
jgi:hypothetical protein